MVDRDHYIPGTWNVVCDVCGFKFKADELRKRWDGMMVCSRDYEERHPQELIRPIKERIGVPWTRKSEPVFIEPSMVDGSKL